MTICIAEYTGTVHCFWMHICITFSFSHISLSKLHPMSIIARHLCSYLLLHFKVRQGIYQGILFSHDCTESLKYVQLIIGISDAGTRNYSRSCFVGSTFKVMFHKI
jgi:hypothetical protein